MNKTKISDVIQILVLSIFSLYLFWEAIINANLFDFSLGLHVLILICITISVILNFKLKKWILFALFFIVDLIIIVSMSQFL